MKKQHLLTFATALLLTGCVSDYTGDEFENGRGDTPLSLDFGIAQPEEASSRAVVNSFSSSDYIGLSLRSAAGTASYDGKSYENIKYGATTKAAVTSSQTPQLSSNTGNIYAYYPYNSSVTNIAAISMSDSQTDYMYASAGTAASSAFSTVTCNDHSNGKTLYMHHAKALLEFTIKRGTYTGTAKINTITASGTLTNTGTLNATTGDVTAGSSNVAVSVSPSLTIGSTSGNSITYNMLVVSRNTSSNQTVTITVDVDGKTYTTSCSILIKPQYKNSITLTLDNAALSVTNLSISGWGTYSSSSSMSMSVGGKTVNVTGLSKYMAISNVNVSGSTLAFDVYPIGDYSEVQIKTPTKSGSASSFTYNLIGNSSYGARNIRVTPTGNVTIAFNGFDDVYRGQNFIRTNITGDTMDEDIMISASGGTRLFRWGETDDRIYYSYDAERGYDAHATPSITTLAYYNGSGFIKYTTSDKKTELESMDDYVTVHYGGKWRMPTSFELESIFGNIRYPDYNCYSGYIKINNKTLFFSPYDYWYDEDDDDDGDYTIRYYWIWSRTRDYSNQNYAYGWYMGRDYMSSEYYSDSRSRNQIGCTLPVFSLKVRNL